MEITEVRIKLMEHSDDRLQAFCSITFDNAFVVRDLKIIEGSNGPFVAMPSRKLTSHCPECGYKNHLRALFCNNCAAELDPDRNIREQDGREKLYADIAHPINSECRETIQNCVIEEYEAELERAQQPGYVPRYDDEYDDDYDEGQREARTDRGHEQQSPPKFSAGGESKSKSQLNGEPPGPHKPPASQKAALPNRPRGNDEFGAGIFDD